MKQHEKIVVYVIDPEESIGEALTVLLNTFGIDVETFHSADDFLAIGTTVNSTRSCILLEQNLQGMDGFSLLRQLKERQISVPVILLTHSANADLRQQATASGVAC